MKTQRQSRMEWIQTSDPPLAAALDAYFKIQDEVDAAAGRLALATEELEAARMRLDRFDHSLDALEIAGIRINDGIRFVRTGEPTDLVNGDRRLAQAERQASPRSKQKRDYQIGLKDLLELGLISMDEPLVTTYKGERHVARINPDGSLNVEGHGTAPTLSWAGRFFTPNEINGWKFWGVERQGMWRPLAELRDQASPR